MLGQAFAVSGIVMLAFAGLVVSNFVYDRGVPSSRSRYLAPILGGAAFLVAVLWLDAWTAITLSGILTTLILVLRVGLPRWDKRGQGQPPDPGVGRGHVRVGRNGQPCRGMGPAR